MESKSNLDIATLKKGTKFRYEGYLYHVVDKCNDDDTTLIITKYLGKYVEGWHYEVFEADRLEELVGNRRITIDE